MASSTANSLLSLLVLALALGSSPTSARPMRRSQQSPSEISSPGPIFTNGRNYTHVCNAGRFASMGLDMSMFPFCNSSLPFDVRVKDLVDSMTIDEKILQYGDQAAGVERLGVPMYNWWSEALHGVSFVGHATYFGDIVPGATSFATVITSAASFNETLWKSIGEVTSTEARAMHNLGHAGLTFWSPNINVVRDPRWGRILETPGEDPFVVGRYAVNFVRGLQDIEGMETADDLNSRPLKVSSCCKHYAAYDVDNWNGVDRYHFDARVTEQDMVETFLRPFEMCVKEGDVSSVMCSYNRVNGIPACADPRLLSQTIRGDWDLHGYIVSDCDSLEVMDHGHHWLQDAPEDAVQQTLRAGLDLDCGDYYPKYSMSAYLQGKIRESDVDNALKNLYTVLMRLGFFDGMPQFAHLNENDICTEDHMELAADSARQGMVLLKNNNSALPLNKDDFKTFAIVGPHANATDVMIGNYAGVPCRFLSPLDAFSNEVDVNYKLGCDVFCRNESLIFPAMQAAKEADATIIFVGLDLDVEAESLDRTDLLLPGYQRQMINQIAMVAKGPVVLVVLSAGGVDIGFARDNSDIDAILWAGYPGAEGGRAIADVVFGRYNPGGKLPLTWHEASYIDALPMTSMQLRPLDELGYPGRTYKFFNGSTVYPFGYGLSYTQFNYTLASSVRSVHKKLDAREFCKPLSFIPGAYVPPCPSVTIESAPCSSTVDFTVEVANTGERDGTHVVMVYSVPPDGISGAPIKQLAAFQRVFVAAGGVEKVEFSLDPCKSMSLVEKSASVVVPSGQHTILIGDGDGAISFPVNVDFKY